MESEETIKVEVYNENGDDYPFSVTLEEESDGLKYISIKVAGVEVARQEWPVIKELFERALDIWDDEDE